MIMKKWIKRLIKGLCLAVPLVFMVTGLSSATIIPWDYCYSFPNLDGSVGAYVYLDLVEPEEADDLYTYIYQLENVAFDPQSNNVEGQYDDIHSFFLPVVMNDDPNSLADYGWHPAGNKENIIPVEGGDDDKLIIFWFNDDAIKKGEHSDPFFISSDYSPGWGLATIQNSGGAVDEDVQSALIAPGGGPGSDPVPEPGTLLLLASGLLAVGGLQYFRARRSGRR
jgi:hypothetical protein